VLAVRCGETVFALIDNEGTNGATGSLTLPLATSQAWRITGYDPERNHTNALPTLSAGGQAIQDITVSPEAAVIVIASPGK
jgi:hypothetical protein